MLDLDSLFPSHHTPVTVPSSEHETGAGSRPESMQATRSTGPTVPSTKDTSNHPESPVPAGSAPILDCRAGGEAGHSGHNGKAPLSGDCAQPESLCHKDFDGLGTVGTVGTVNFQGGGCVAGGGAPGGGAARQHFALHPSAVVLALAYCREAGTTSDERMATLLGLEALPPGEQVRRWHSACIDIGIKPWETLFLPAPSAGMDCTMCKHLTTRQMVGDSGRREFHWACGKGYLILETGRGSERIWIAPPECKSWERWYPSDRR